MDGVGSLVRVGLGWGFEECRGLDESVSLTWRSARKRRKRNGETRREETRRETIATTPTNHHLVYLIPYSLLLVITYSWNGYGREKRVEAERRGEERRGERRRCKERLVRMMLELVLELIPLLMEGEERRGEEGEGE